MKKIGNIILKSLGWGITGLILFVLIVIGGLNVSKRFIYFEYYSTRENVCKIAGINDGFIPQGLGYSEDNNLILQSGYFAKTNYCAIYLVDENGKSKRINIVNEDGTRYVGHFGGIACYKDYVYVSEDYISGDYDVSNRLYIFSMNDLLELNNNDSITIKEYINVDTEGSTVSYYDGYLYVGEYYSKGSYETDQSHKLTTLSGEYQHALICAYPIDENKEFYLGELEYQISAPGKIQGFTKKGNTCVISTSWGPLSSNLGYYEMKDMNKTISSSGKEVPLYYIDSSTLIKNVKMPAMSEGVFLKDDKIYTYFESSGNKYYFGKLFNAFYIVSLPFLDK
ncbi:MAG: hypothetical protein SOW55_01125 [Bacilli bacterium]|nr:hypothetical protein [Bacillales bacterium]MDY2574576.1 hypothetical protein [Bacilli bacterium]